MAETELLLEVFFSHHLYLTCNRSAIKSETQADNNSDRKEFFQRQNFHTGHKGKLFPIISEKIEIDQSRYRERSVKLVSHQSVTSRTKDRVGYANRLILIEIELYRLYQFLSIIIDSF